MTEAQKAAFVRSSSVEPETLLGTVAAVMAAIILLWLAWLTYSQYRLWQEGKEDFYDLIYMVVSGAVVTLVVGFFIQ